MTRAASAAGKSDHAPRCPDDLWAEVAEAAGERGLDPRILLGMLLRSALDALPVVERMVDDGKKCKCGNHGRP